MKKVIVRGLVAAAALMVLAGSTPQPALGKHLNGRGGHRGGHHCRHNPHRHDRDFYRQQAQEQNISLGRARQQHRHHHHQCKNVYPPA